MRWYVKAGLIPIAIAEAVLCGCMMALECFLDFWHGDHMPFGDD